MSEDNEDNLIIVRVREFKNGQRVITIPNDDKTLKAGDHVKIIKIKSGVVI